ncbi:MAG: PAS domain-containing protein [Erysipelotrichaceae bacterium]|nr:PAS domain-containing protein [Erysipelotrichaceae bacterium]
MTRRIFQAVLFIVLMTFLIYYTLMLRVMFDYLSDYQYTQMQDHIQSIAKGIDLNGLEYIQDVETDERIVWLDSRGNAIYDNTDGSREDVEESAMDVIENAKKDGFDSEIKNSRQFQGDSYYMARRLQDDGVVLMVSPQRSMYTIMRGMTRPILIIMALIIAIVLDYAFQISKDIVQPLNELDLDNPLSNEEYSEVRPLLTRIDEQQKALRVQRDELIRRRNEFETIMNSINEGMVLLSVDGTVITANQFICSVLQVSQKQLIGRKLKEFTQNSTLLHMIEKAGQGEHRTQLIEKEGASYQVTADPVFNHEQVIGSALTVLNVTDREKMEEIRREFTANVSHELKTPLHTISGSAELLKNGIVKPEDRQQFYDRIYSEAQRMNSMVTDIMELSKSDNNKDMTFESMDVYQIAQDVISELKIMADKKGVRIGLQGHPSMAWADKDAVTSILTNLISNAIKYNKDNGTVEVSVKEVHNRVQIKIKDSGIGIPVEDQERIFERFYRVDKSRSRQAGGTGLGLSIVHNLVQGLNGTLELQSVPEKGSEFTVMLPKYNEQG